MRLLCRVVFALLLLTFWAPKAEAQESDIIRGRVFGPDSTPLAGVTISVTGTRSQTTRTARTDSRGSYTIINLRATLSLTQAQVDTLNKLNTRVLAVRDSISSAMAKLLAALPDHRRIPGDVAKQYQDASLAMQLVLARLTPSIKSLLKPEQTKKAPFSVTSWLNRTPREVERMFATFGFFGGFGGGEIFIAF